MAEIVQGAWGAVTDPSAHNPAEFRYLVHMDHGVTMSRWNQRLEALVRERPELLGAFYMDNLSNLTHRPTLSASLIDQDHMNTFYGRAGLILHVPTAGIVANAPEDLYSGFDDASSDTERAKRRGLIDPSTLLARTTGHNEVVCSTESIVVGGLLFLTDRWKDRQYLKPSQTKVRKRAEELNLPLVELDPNEESSKNFYRPARYIH